VSAPADRRRSAPQFYDALALPRERLPEPDALGGCAGAVCSRDERSGSQTLLVELPPGWRRALDGAGATLELFVLRGDVSLDGVRVGPSGYVIVPEGCGGGELRSEGGASALAFWNPNMPTYPAPYAKKRAVRLREVPYDVMPRDAESHGIMSKSLRVPDPMDIGGGGGPGGFLRLMYMAPAEISPFEHAHHECFEEIFCLQGDVLLADEGLMGVGSYSAHPQEWWHGPYVSRFGALLLVHTDAPMGHPWGRREYPGELELVEAYLDEGDWGLNEAHTPWCALPWTRFNETPVFAAWVEAGQAPEYGSVVGRDTASRFRASWKRSPDADAADGR
jgi:hypothetical protein